jgi:hypothetical protein
MKPTEIRWARKFSHHKSTGKKAIFKVFDPKKLKGDIT